MIRKILFIALVLMALILPAHAYNNSITGDESTQFTTSPQTVNFDTETSGLAYTWYVNSVEISETGDNLNYNFTDKGVYNVTVTYTGDNTISWYATITRPVETTAQTETLDTSAYTEIEDSFSGQFNLFDIADSATQHYVNSIGNIFYFIIIGVTLAIMWKEQKNIIIPAVIVVIFADLTFSLIPESYVLFGKLFIVLAATAVTIKLYLDSKFG